MSFVKNATAGAVLGGSLLFTAGLGMAHAQPVDDGLVNLSVGQVTLLEGVSADTVATAAGALCSSVPGDVTALATQVDSSGTQQTVCSGLPGGDLVVTQNVSAAPAAPAPAAPAAPAEEPAPAEESAPAEEPAPEGEAETGSGDGLGAPEGTGEADGGTVPLPSDG